MNLCHYGCGNEGIYILSNGYYCCQKTYQKCPEVRRKSSHSLIGRYINTDRVYGKSQCPHCSMIFSNVSIKHHIKSCYMNPLNLKICPVCGNPIKDYKHSRTCSKKCAHIYSKEKYLAVWKKRTTDYRKIAFRDQIKKCIICNEENIVCIHHFDGNHENNQINNLIPLCPTHHSYCHSSFYDLIKEKIEKYRITICE